MRVHLAFLLRAKHWQIFLFVTGAVLVFDVVAIEPLTQSRGNLQQLTEARTLLGIFWCLLVLALLAWSWTLGAFLHSIIEPALRLSLKRFRFAVIVPLLYFPVAFFMFITSDEERMRSAFPLIFPLHLLAFLCLLYNLYFVSKSLKLAEMRKPVSFYDYSGPLFLFLWFVPLGVWFIQPRINELFAQAERGAAGSG